VVVATFKNGMNSVIKEIVDSENSGSEFYFVISIMKIKFLIITQFGIHIFNLCKFTGNNILKF